jgi:hypothetical protein
MTAQQALQRLKQTGRLSTEPRPANALDPADISSPVAHAAYTLARRSSANSRRWIAPSVNLTVLP